MAQMTELRREDKTRRRNSSALAAVGVTVLITGAGWFAMTQMGDDPDSAPPASTVTTPSPDGDLDVGLSVGSHMNPPIDAHAPKSWVVDADLEPVVRLTRGSMTIEIQGPMVGLIRPTNRGGANYPPIGPAGYAHWLRSNGAGVEVLEDQMVTVDGEQVPQLRVIVLESPWFLGEVPGMGDTDALWQTFNEADEVTITVIEVHGKPIVVASFGAETDADRAELQAATEFVLSTMKLPVSR